MIILGNSKLTQSSNLPSMFEHPNQGDGYRIRAYMQGVNGFSAYGLTEPNMTDTAFDKAKVVGAYVFQKFYEKGVNDIPASLDTVMNNLKIRDDNATLNEGKGPGFICSTISSIFNGIMVTYGVQIMSITGITSDSSQADTSSCVFCPEFNKWVWYCPMANAYVLLPDGVTPASPIELEIYYRKGLNDLLVYKSGTATIQTDTGYDQYGEAFFNWWRSTGTLVLTGGLFYSCIYALYPRKRPLAQNTALWYNTLPYPLYLSGKSNLVNSNSLAASYNDIFRNVNCLEVSSENKNGLMMLNFKHNMIAFKTLQKSTDGITWTDMRGMSDIIDSVDSGSIFYHAVSFQDVSSNVIEVRY